MTDALASRTDPRDPPPAVDAPAPRDAATASGDDGNGAGLLAALVGVSVAVHLAIGGGLAGAARGARASHRARPPSVVTMEIAPPPPAPEVAAPRPPAAAAPRRAPTRTVPVAAPPTAAPRAVEAPADFSGVTLTNDGLGSGWSSATGNGNAMTGPLGRPGTAANGAARPATAAVIPLSALSRPPSPPDLNATLEAHYPPEARRLGLAGRAVLRAHITAEGRASDLVLLTQSAAGFGEACRAALRDAVWTPPLDRNGHPVATVVTYTCQFEVR